MLTSLLRHQNSNLVLNARDNIGIFSDNWTAIGYIVFQFVHFTETTT